jgi:hypothetical protein
MPGRWLRLSGKLVLKMRILPAEPTRNFRDPHPGTHDRPPLGEGETAEEKVVKKDRRGPAVIVDLSAEAKALIS